MADGEILINTKIQTDDAKDDLKKLKKELEDVADSASESAEDLESSFEKVDIADSFDTEADKIKDELEDIADTAEETGKAMSGIGSGSGGMLAGIMGGISGALTQKALDLLKEAGEALVEFGKESIELGSDLQEVQNVVDVTFSTMSGQVDEFAKNAAASAGLSETMAKKYTGTFGAMAKSFGFTEQEAFDMSTTLTQLTGDVASFYNLDHDEAYTKLKAVFTGETEALKELGIVMTQSALDQYAMEKGIKKTTAQMTEQEKTALRYSFVVDKLSGASGDFVRTQDSWANQTRILSLQWESFMASIGEALIEILTPSLQFLTGTVMPALNDFADWFSDFVSDDPAEELAEGFDELSESMDENITKADGTVVTYADMQAAIEGVESSVEALKLEYEEAREKAKESLDSQIGLLTELETKSDKTAREIVDNWKKQQSALNEYAFNMRKAISMGLDRALVQQLADGSQESMLILDELVNGTSASISEINREFQNVQRSKEVVASVMADVQTDMSRRLNSISNDIENEWGDMADEVGRAVREMQDYINGLQGKTVYIDLVGRQSSSTSFGGGYFDPGARGKYTLEPENVPQLATGAVIPPNAPFTAVLGDQRNGYNLEGPEDMFRSIVREEIEAASGNETNELLSDILMAINNAKMTVNESGVFQIIVEENNRAVRSYGYSPLRV